MRKNVYVIILSIGFSIFLWASVSLSNDFITILHLPIKFINVPDGYVPTSPSLENVNIKVKGKGWNLLTAMVTAQSDFFVDAGSEHKKKNVLDLHSFSAENTWLTSKFQILEIAPDTISFDFEKLVYSKLIIVPQLRLDFKSGYGLASDVIVIPESTVVAGPLHEVSAMTDVPTELVKLSDLSEKTEAVIELKDFPGLSYVDQSVKVIFNVQRIVENSFGEISVNVTDIPSDREVVLLPNKINVSLRGGIDVLGKLNKERIIATINYRELVIDTIGSVTPKLEIPEHTELVYIKPESLKYVIKKFNK